MNISLKGMRVLGFGTLTLGILAASIYTAPALAEPPIGDAVAHDLSVHINLLGVTTLDVDAQTEAQITAATTDVADQEQIVSLDIADPLNLIQLHTGTLHAEAQYVAGSLSAIASQATVEDLDLSAVGIGNVDVLSLLGGVVQSRSALAGTCPPVTAGATGLLDDFVFFHGFDEGGLVIGDGGSGAGGLPGSGSTLGEVELSVLGIVVPGLPLNPPPNTVVDLSQLGIIGATLVLNERIVSGNGVTDLSLTSNAIHLTLDVAGLVTADIIIAHSSAALSCL